MRASPVIAASLLSADFAKLGAEADAVTLAGADWVHVDVMDNHYVPNLTFGPLVCRALTKYGLRVPMDVHLMVEPVEALIEAFAEAGAQTITFHPDACRHVDRALTRIRDLGCRAGLAFNPASSLGELSHLMDKLDQVLLMSVNPGFGGQSFIESSLAKIEIVRSLIDTSDAPIRLAVDGGINVDTINRVYAAGADTIIAGHAIFGQSDYAAAINALRLQMR